MSSFAIAEKVVDIFPSTETTAPIIYLNTFSGEGQKIYEAARAANYPQFTLVAISDLGWNHDMVPWDSPSAFKNADPSLVAQMTIFDSSLRRLFQRQRRRLLVCRPGVGS